jgi:hypothetical protein
MISATLEHENDEGCPKRDLRFIRNTSGGENDDDRDEVEKIVIYQGCNQRVLKSLYGEGNFSRKQSKTYMKGLGRSRETVLFVKVPSLQEIPFKFAAPVKSPVTSNDA